MASVHASGRTANGGGPTGAQRSSGTPLRPLRCASPGTNELAAEQARPHHVQARTRANQIPIAKEPIIMTTKVNTNKGIVLFLACVAQFMVVLDIAIVNVALPSIQRDLHIGQSTLQWIVIAYGLMLGGFLLFGGRMADLLGRRRVLLAGLTLFSAASLLAGVAGSAGFLIGARALQGFGAALVPPAALSILAGTLKEGAERNRALGLYGATAGVAASVGVIASGLLTKGPGWRGVFCVHVPVAAVRNRTLLAAHLSAFFLFGAFFAFIFLGALLMQQVLGYSPTRTGVAWLATTVMSFFAAGIAGAKLVGVVGVRRLLVGGFTLLAIAALLLTRVPAGAHYATDLLPALILAGLAGGISAPAIQIGALSGVPHSMTGLAGGLVETLREIGGGVIVAIVATVLVSRA